MSYESTMAFAATVRRVQRKPSTLEQAADAYTLHSGYAPSRPHSWTAFFRYTDEQLQGAINALLWVVGNFPVYDSRRDHFRFMRKYYAKRTGTSYIPDKRTGA